MCVIIHNIWEEKKKKKKEDFKRFKVMYLDKFRLYYKDKNTNRKELKRSIDDSPKLTNIQKKRFWELVTK